MFGVPIFGLLLLMKVSLPFSLANTITIICSTIFQWIKVCIKDLVDSGYRPYIKIS